MAAPDRRGQAVLPDGTRPAAHVQNAPDIWLLAAAFAGSLCLFLLKLFAGEFLLPRFGGAPSVWVSCLAFFQVALVAGYFFADRVGRLSAPRIQFAVIGGLFASTTLATVVIARRPDMLAIGDGVARAIAVPLVLTCTVGPIFFTLAPLLGHRHAEQGRHDRGGDHGTGDVAYRLYAASNAGSFLALVAYPLAIENVAGLSRQAEIIAGLFLLVAGLTLTAGWRLTRHTPRSTHEQAMRSEPAVGWRRWLRWAFLAAIPASWLSSITTYATAGMVPGLPPSRSLWLVAIGVAALVALFAVDRRERAVSLALVLLAAFWMIEQERHVLYRTRTFFGVLRVEASDNGPSRELVHGTIRHGVQLVSGDPDVPEDFARLASRWMALTRSVDIAKRVYSTTTSPRWQWQPSLPGQRAPVWTDDRTSVTDALFHTPAGSAPSL